MSAIKVKPKAAPKSQYMQVYVRCRPLGANEVQPRNLSTVEVQCPKNIVIHERCNTKVSKTYSFDKVFPPESSQADVYESVVEPLISDVLSGYNCTVFAYGQTGSGKTFTMEGDFGSDKTFSRDTKAGAIPRAVCALFDELRMLQAEYTVRISFMELYNEELYDLLSPDEVPPKLRLFDDPSKKGSVLVQGLQEVMVHTQSQVLEELSKGTAKRQVAATLMNAHSSRSHTIFCITVHTKESSMEGEELLRTGKLYLVDLAGSENIGRSGSIDKRAREAASINQSLLTLSRVTACIVDRQPHVPYRESKLTRILQDSFGGRTKTSMIATISPAQSNVEETISTLEYALRAKSVANKPEVNQKVSQNALEKEYESVIDDLRKKLDLARNGSGVYVNNENYKQIMDDTREKNQQILDLIGKIREIQQTKKNLEATFASFSTKLETEKHNLQTINKTIAKTTEKIHVASEVLKNASNEQQEATTLLGSLTSQEDQLQAQSEQLKQIAESASTDSEKIHDRLDYSRVVLIENKASLRKLQDPVSLRLDAVSKMHSSLSEGFLVLGRLCSEIEKLDESVKADSCDFLESIEDFFENFSESLKQFKSMYCSVEMERESLAQKTLSEIEASRGKFVADLELLQKEQSDACTAFHDVVSKLSKLSPSLVDLINESALQRHTTTLKGMNKMKEDLSNNQEGLDRNIQMVSNFLNELLSSKEDSQEKITKMMNTLCETPSAISDYILKSIEGHTSLGNDCLDISETMKKKISLAAEQIVYTDTLFKKKQHDLQSERDSISTGFMLCQESFARGEESLLDTVSKTVSEAQTIQSKALKQRDHARTLDVVTPINKILEDREDAWSHCVESLDCGVCETKLLAHSCESTSKTVSTISQDIGRNRKEFEYFVDETTESFLDGTLSSKAEFVELVETGETSIKELVSSDIKYDLPTGQTPARKAYGPLPSLASLPSPVVKKAKSRIEKASWVRLLRSPRKPLSSTKSLQDDDCMASDSEITTSKTFIEPFGLQKSSSLSDLRSKKGFTKPRIPKKFLRKPL